MSRTLLLVSVRCADEVAIAVDGGADIIDVKEPTHGSLGMATPETLATCATVVPEQLLWTVAGGELVENIESGFAAVQEVGGQGVACSRRSLKRLPDAVKFGLSQCEGTPWEHVFQNVGGQLPECVQVIPVAYADQQAASSPAVDTVLEAAARHGWETVLVDTFDKLQSGSLLDLVAVGTIEQWVARMCQSVLAASLWLSQYVQLFVWAVETVELTLSWSGWSPHSVGLVLLSVSETEVFEILIEGETLESVGSEIATQPWG